MNASSVPPANFISLHPRVTAIHVSTTPCLRQVRAAFAAGGVLIVGGWVDAKKSVGYVDWALLLLVGSALGLSKAIANSGLAGYAGNAIRESGMSASASLYLLYGFTMVSLGRILDAGCAKYWQTVAYLD